MTGRDPLATTWLSCADCGVHRLDPLPTEDELATVYGTGYAAGHARYAPAYAAVVADEYARSLADLGMTPAQVAGLRVLDYGCAAGPFLDWLAASGAPSSDVLGVDLSAEMVAIATARGHRATTVAVLPTLDERFDLVTLWDVLEHLLDPLDTLRMLTRLLVPGGRLLVQTPHVGLLADRLGPCFVHYMPVQHVHLFRRRTLVRLFAAVGMRCVAAASFGASAQSIPQPFKAAYDALAKHVDEGATQLALFERADAAAPALTAAGARTR